YSAGSCGRSASGSVKTAQGRHLPVSVPEEPPADPKERRSRGLPLRPSPGRQEPLPHTDRRASPPPRCAPGPVSRRAPSEGPPPVAGSVGFLDVGPVVPKARCFGGFSGAVITVGVPDVGFALSPLRAVHPADGSVSQPLLPASLRGASPPPSQRRRRSPLCRFLSEEVFPH
ncbi:Titin, partial [Manis pentadactyla]